MTKLITNLRFFFFFIALILMPHSCSKDVVDCVPDTYVDITLNTNNFFIGMNDARIVTNTMVNVQSLGYNNNGIIVYLGNDGYYAYDRTCTYHVEKSIAVNIEAGNTLFAVCPVCSTRYQLYFSGIPTDAGPSKCPLKQYKTFYNPNTFELQIYNF